MTFCAARYPHHAASSNIEDPNRIGMREYDRPIRFAQRFGAGVGATARSGTVIAGPRNVMSTCSTQGANFQPYAVLRSTLASSTNCAGLAAIIQLNSAT
jgi:hypothetical protein